MLPMLPLLTFLQYHIYCIQSYTDIELAFLYPQYFVEELYTNPEHWMFYNSPWLQDDRRETSVYRPIHADDCDFIHDYFMINFNISTIGLCATHNTSLRPYPSSAFEQGAEICQRFSTYTGPIKCKSILYQMFITPNINYVAFLYNNTFNETHPLVNSFNSFNLSSMHDWDVNVRSVYATIYDKDTFQYIWGDEDNNNDKKFFNAYPLTDQTQNHCIGIKLKYTNPGPGEFAMIAKDDYVESYGIESILYIDDTSGNDTINNEYAPYTPWIFGSNWLSYQYVTCLPPDTYQFVMINCNKAAHSSYDADDVTEFNVYPAYDQCTHSYVSSGESFSASSTDGIVCRNSYSKEIVVSTENTLYNVIPEIANVIDKFSIINVADTFIVFACMITNGLTTIFIIIGVIIYYIRNHNIKQLNGCKFCCIILYLIYLMGITTFSFFGYVISVTPCVRNDNYPDFWFDFEDEMASASEGNDGDVGASVGGSGRVFGFLLACIFGELIFGCCIWIFWCIFWGCKFVRHWMICVQCLFCPVFIFTFVILISFGGGIFLGALFYVILIPIMVVALFYVLQKPFDKWYMNIVSMYLIILDLLTDLLVIYYFFHSKDYFWATLQILFILFAKLFGAIDADRCTFTV